MESVKESVARLMEWTPFFAKVSSITTDGENKNTGTKSGMWARLKKERDESGLEIPLLTIWCAVHRSDLAFEDLEKRVLEIKRCIGDVVGLATFFHRSSVNSAELKQFAEDNKMHLKTLPAHFEIRFAEHTERLFEAVLTSKLFIASSRIIFRYFCFSGCFRLETHNRISV